MTVELAVLIVCALGASGLIVYSLWPASDEQAEAIRRRAMGLKNDAPDPTDLKGQARAAARNTLIAKAAPLISKHMLPQNEEEQSNLRIKLSNAGFRSDAVAAVFMASKLVCAVGLLLVALFYTWHSGKPTSYIFGYGAVGGGLGFFLPEFWLSLHRSNRMEAIRNGLPDALDLMVVSVEAGLGLDAALQRVGDEMRNVHMELAEEIQIAVMETQMGIVRAAALEKMAIRTGVEEMKSLIAVITQAEKLGTSIAKALRTQAETLRTKRRQKAEERAQKTAVKLMLPLILFIFPAIMIVLGAPAGIKLYQTMSGGGFSGGK